MKSYVHHSGRFLLSVAFTVSAIVLQAQVSHNVTVSDNTFSPSSLEIIAGDTVKWTNIGGSHNVNGTQGTFPENPASFGNDVGTGWTYTFVFTVPGTYDYQCDPHASMGMTGTIVVLENGGGETSAEIKIDFSSMNPHLNQQLWLALIDQETGEIIRRIHDTVKTEAFSEIFPEVETGRSYNIDFYADHNQSGNYNAPPDDHAWRLEVMDLAKDTTLVFVHNTTFTDIAWKHAITLSLTSMNPHLGQKLVVYIVNDETDEYVDTLTIDEISESAFEVVSYNVEIGGAYRIDFYADHNGNGTYDAPPADHAWRIEIETLNGDTVVPFVHNTTFTNIFETPTGIDKRNESGIILFPNPAGDYLRITGDELPESLLDIQVMNMAGQLVRQVKATNNDNLVINLSGLSKGAYYLIIKSKEFNAHAKFLKAY